MDAMLCAIDTAFVTRNVVVPPYLSASTSYEAPEEFGDVGVWYVFSRTAQQFSSNPPSSSTPRDPPLIGRTSGIPSPGCREDTPGGSSATERCSGSGRHAVENYKVRMTLAKMGTETYVADAPGDCALFASS